jgi:predicted aspartyl protease
MLEKNDFFRLETRLEQERKQLSQSISLYLDANLQNAFNQTGQSLQTIDILLNRHSQSLNDSLLWEIYNLKSDNLVKQYRYRESVEALKIAIDNYGHAADSTQLANAVDMYSVFEPLSAFPPQQTHITKDVTIPVQRNQFNHLLMQVSSGEQANDFVFDTGANLCVISESCASRMGVRVLESSSQIGNSVGSKVQSRVGIADSLRIGDLLVQNIAFLVLPDELLTFSLPDFDYLIHGIIGFPVMYQMNEIRIHKDESITVVANPAKRDLRNLFLSGFSPIVRAEAVSDTILFKMDTGANTTELSNRYFIAHRDEVLKNGTLKKALKGGAGGIIEAEIYELENFLLKIGSRELTLPTISVETEEFSFTKNFDGNLGQDVLMHFNQLILNFTDMFLAFED